MQKVIQNMLNNLKETGILTGIELLINIINILSDESHWSERFHYGKILDVA